MFNHRKYEGAIIAMKGPPFTRKSALARSIAKSLGYPVLSLDCVLNRLPQPSINQTPNTCPQDLAFDIICDIAVEHLSSNNSVVIDSPLSSESHTCRLTKIASSFRYQQVRVVIVECKPKNTYLWQMKFEDCLELDPEWALKWYRPKNWDDIKKAINEDYDVDDSHEFISKLVVDSYMYRPRNFMEAVRYMMTRDKGDGRKIVTFDDCQQSRYLSSFIDNNSESTKSVKNLIYCKDGLHRILEGVDYEGYCMACKKQVIIGGEGSYACKDCKLVLHKDCAESFGKEATPFRREFPCAPCKEDGNDFSEGCAFCLFESHIGNRWVPTVLKDLSVDEHFLSIVLTPPTIGHHYDDCKACGETGIFDSYASFTSTYMCRICSFTCHYHCFTLPRRVKQEHGGHYHIMSLMLSSKPDEEDYMCDECQEKRNLELWYYSCQDCAFIVHLKCVEKTSYLVPVI